MSRIERAPRPAFVLGGTVTVVAAGSAWALAQLLPARRTSANRTGRRPDQVPKATNAEDAAEIRAITDAMVRPLIGAPLHSDDKLTIVSLATKARSRRNKLTHTDFGSLG
ncbi:hypothetical protein [Streptomyces sp. NPDC018972]|uniref:hypothetical protein n=1 Tax=Streptomyces sp. NPDC018972 TaxID=3365060 RepID=UPI0037A3E1EA